MARVLLLCLATSIILAGTIAQGQPVSDLYRQYLQAGGVPYKVGNGFYTAAGCSYTIDYFGQCGGSGSACNPASGVCLDAQYPGACCPVGFQCVRENPQYWQCQQSGPTYKLAPAGSYPLGPYEQCGGTPPANTSFVVASNGKFQGTACPDGYTCTYQSSTYSNCAPYPLTVTKPQTSPLLNIVSQIDNLLGVGSTLAPGVVEYDFIFPGAGNTPPKPVSVKLNVTAIGEAVDGLFNKTAPVPTAQPTPTPLPTPNPPAPAPAPPAFNFTVPNINFKPRPPLTISGTSIVDTSGNPVNLHGVNWFGFEVGQTMVDGLYQNYQNPRNFSQVGDFSTIVYRQQALGFNAVRLPFRFADLNIAPPNNFTRACSADSIQQIIGNLSNPTVPYYQTNYNSLTFPPQTAPILPPLDVATSGQCNAYLPNDTTLNRFLYVIQFYIGNGFYVAIDFHGSGGSETDRQIVANPNIFQANWVGLLQALQSLPTYNSNIKGRIFFDLLNEPDGFNMTWSYPNVNSLGSNANSSTVPSWGNLYTSTADALLRQEPNLLLFAEGTGQQNQPGTAYGQGFGINPAIYTNQYGLSNALIGLQTLCANAAVRAKTIITPHVYGYQVTGWTQGNTNPALPGTYYNNYAYLGTQGVPDATGVNQTFPILAGEFGNTFNSSYNSTVDNFSDPLTDQWIHDFALFANNLDPVGSAQYPHLNINSSFWWDWNANSYPQLGLVNADPGQVTNYTGPLQPGWLTIQWIKINNLTDTLNNNFFSQAARVASGGGFGLRPWYLPPTTH